MTTTSEWTDDQRSTLKELWPTPMSATEIGLRCGGKSKGAVIGLANRLKLGSKKPDRISHKGKANIRKPTLALVRSEPDPVPQMEPVAVFVPEKPVSFEELETGMCRWPIGDPCDETFAYCGCDSKGRPFCDEHEKVAYGHRHVRSGRSLPPLRTRRAFR